MEGLTTALPVIIYLLLIILLVIGIILGIKLIITIDKTNAILDDVSKKVATLDTVFGFIDPAETSFILKHQAYFWSTRFLHLDCYKASRHKKQTPS